MLRCVVLVTENPLEAMQEQSQEEDDEEVVRVPENLVVTATDQLRRRGNHDNQRQTYDETRHVGRRLHELPQRVKIVLEDGELTQQVSILERLQATHDVVTVSGPRGDERF